MITTLSSRPRKGVGVESELHTELSAHCARVRDKLAARGGGGMRGEGAAAAAAAQRQTASARRRAERFAQLQRELDPEVVVATHSESRTKREKGNA